MKNANHTNIYGHQAKYLHEQVISTTFCKTLVVDLHDGEVDFFHSIHSSPQLHHITAWHWNSRCCWEIYQGIHAITSLTNKSSKCRQCFSNLRDLTLIKWLWEKKEQVQFVEAAPPNPRDPKDRCSDGSEVTVNFFLMPNFISFISSIDPSFILWHEINHNYWMNLKLVQ